MAACMAPAGDGMFRWGLRVGVVCASRIGGAREGVPGEMGWVAVG